MKNIKQYLILFTGLQVFHFLILTYWIFTGISAIYGTNDDSLMSSISSGNLTGNYDNHLIFIEPIFSIVIKYLEILLPNYSGYSLFLIFVTTSSFVSILTTFIVLKKINIFFLIFYIISFISLQSWYAINPTYTGASLFSAGAAAADDEEAGWVPLSSKGTTPGATSNARVAGDGQVTPESVDEESDAGVSEEAKRQRTIRRLTKIHAALESYRKRNGTYPTPSLDLKLSWRVMILHDLGYGALYSRFRMGEPWNSPHNLKLAAEIPDEFRGPHVDAPKTNFLLMRGAGTAFPTEEGLDPTAMVDQPENTLLLAEVDPQYAAVWTQPGDYQVARDRLQQEFFGLHRDGCFGVFGGETGVRFIPANISDEALSAILTPAGREEVSAVEVARLPVASIDRPLIELLAKQPISRDLVSLVTPGSGSPNNGQGAKQQRGDRSGSGSPDSQDANSRWDLPTPASVKEAEASLNEIYGAPAEIAKKKKEDQIGRSHV